MKIKQSLYAVAAAAVLGTGLASGASACEPVHAPCHHVRQPCHHHNPCDPNKPTTPGHGVGGGMGG